jgi:hypothetical protein
MAFDPEGEVEFKAAGKKFTAVFGMRAIKNTEVHFADEAGDPKPFLQVVASVMPQVAPEDIGDKAKMFAAAAKMRFSDIATLFGFALDKHHRELEEEEVENIIDELGLSKVTEILGNVITAALADEEGDEEAPRNPPKRGRSRSTG